MLPPEQQDQKSLDRQEVGAGRKNTIRIHLLPPGQHDL